MCLVYVMFGGVFFCFKQKTAYEMRISDWSSDVCSSDLNARGDVDGDAAQFELQLGAANLGRQEQPRQVLRHFGVKPEAAEALQPLGQQRGVVVADRKSVVEGKRVSVRVDLGGRRIIKKKKKKI